MARGRKDVTIYELTADVAHDVWRDLQPIFEPAMRYHPVMDVIDLYHICMAGRGQVVVAIDGGGVIGAAVMEVVQFPSNRVGNILALGGAPGFLAAHMDEFGRYLIRWSAERGCDRIGFQGRCGWARWLQRHFPAVIAPPTVTCWMPVDGRDTARLQ